MWFIFGALLLVTLYRTNGHAMLEKPKSRNFIAAETCQSGPIGCPDKPTACKNAPEAGCREHNSCSLQAGGWANVAQRGNLQWPSMVGSHGLCGDPVETRGENYDWRRAPYMMPTQPVATYNAGDVVEFTIGVCTEQGGHYEFRICDKQLFGLRLESEQAGQDCLDKWVLKRAPPTRSGPDSQPIDTKHPGRWYVPNARGTAAFSNDTFHPSSKSTSTWTMRFVIPSDLQCTRCTLQWWWVTGNGQCAFDKDVGDYYSRNGISPAWGVTTPICGGNQYFTEEFWNCADITVLSSKKPPGPGEAPRRRKGSRRRRRKGSRRRRRRRRSSQ